MDKKLLLGMWRYLLPIPPRIWRGQVDQNAEGGINAIKFMSPDHHRVRDLVVRELPRYGRPIPPGWISEQLNLPLETVIHILEELERGLTFLYRNPQGLVAWAYPVTVDKTPHQITFSSGEKLYAAWAVDAIATPFVQGQLRQEHLNFSIQTSCAHCGQSIHIEIDSDLQYKVAEAEADPLVFVPMVNFAKLKDPSIIDAFWRNSVFFWSEEHAKEYRKTHNKVRGTYFTLEQTVYMIPPTQGAIFGFPRKERK